MPFGQDKPDDGLQVQGFLLSSQQLGTHGLVRGPGVPEHFERHDVPDVF